MISSAVGTRQPGMWATWLSVGVVVGGLLLGGCSPERPTEVQMPTLAAYTAEGLANALRAAGGEAEVLGPGQDTLEGAKSHRLRLGTQELEVFELEAGLTLEQAAAALVDRADGKPRIWAADSMIVQYPGEDGATILLVSGLLGDPVPSVGGVTGGPYPPAVTAAIALVAREAEIPPERVAVSSYEAVAWSDTCLGWAAPDEQCQGPEVAGWRILLQAGGEEFEVHSDKIGERIRLR